MVYLPPFAPDHKIWDGVITVSRVVHCLYSFGPCVSRCRFWRVRDILLGKARMRRLLELCMSSRGLMGKRPIWLWNGSWSSEVKISGTARRLWFRERGVCCNMFRLRFVILRGSLRRRGWRCRAVLFSWSIVRAVLSSLALYNDAFAVFVGIGLSLYYMFLPFMWALTTIIRDDPPSYPSGELRLVELSLVIRHWTIRIAT